jgi:hypothetical protein
MEADMLERINDYYSDEIAGHLMKGDKVKVTADYALRNADKNLRDAIPLPATLLIEIGERISRLKSGMKVRLYSDHSWRPEGGGAKDDFQRKSLSVLQRRVANGETDLSFHEFGEKDDEPVVRFSKGQVMKHSCLECHNAKNGLSPKKDWKVGDLVGVLEVTRPLERDIDRTSAGLRGSFILMGTVAATLLGVSLVLLFGARRR